MNATHDFDNLLDYFAGCGVYRSSRRCGGAERISLEIPCFLAKFTTVYFIYHPLSVVHDANSSIMTQVSSIVDFKILSSDYYAFCTSASPGRGGSV